MSYKKKKTKKKEGTQWRVLLSQLQKFPAAKVLPSNKINVAQFSICVKRSLAILRGHSRSSTRCQGLPSQGSIPSSSPWRSTPRQEAGSFSSETASAQGHRAGGDA
uniref:Uncharacterized protein n=1 Tax=Sphaerodactylus townsendi TaxID=933632 RepID=A0ACB8EXS5_9SAUR